MLSSLKNIQFFCLFSLCFSQCLLGQKSDQVYEDEIFDPQVKSVLLYPETRTVNETVRAPIISIDQIRPLRLEFDILEEEYRVLQARIIHCNADWTQSVLNDMEYVQGYNGFDIQEFDYSSMGKVLYVNYWFYLPRVKISGNYIIEVYQNNNPRDVILSKRFIVYENNTLITPRVRVSTSVSSRNASQQVDFKLNYARMNVRNPRTEVKVVLRQNNRWDNTLKGLQPTRVDPIGKELEYFHFGGENTFQAGNEFRFIDIRTYTFRGRYISSIDRNKTPIRMETNIDQGRARSVYSELQDMNGAFILSTMEAGASYLDADYINVQFRLKAQPTPEAVYVLGSFNDWKKDDRSLMQYDPKSGIYFRNVLMKQGIYDYMYFVDGQNPLKFEGSFYQTNNQYDIIVYYKSFTDLTDRVIGYQSFFAEL